MKERDAINTLSSHYLGKYAPPTQAANLPSGYTSHIHDELGRGDGAWLACELASGTQSTERREELITQLVRIDYKSHCSNKQSNDQSDSTLFSHFSI